MNSPAVASAKGKPRDLRHAVLMVVFLIGTVTAMTGWLYALGWVTVKLISLI